MFKIKTLTMRNFLSIGNIVQSINFSNSDLVLVLGENLDLGGNDNRNGCGKCLRAQTEIDVQCTNPETAAKFKKFLEQ